jgi:hypothetical protein
VTGAPYQKVLLWSGVLLIASGVFHLGVWLATGAGSLDGAVTWRKPIEFGISGGLTAVTLVWVLSRVRPNAIAGWTVALTVACFVPETALISLQQWRGVPSHFNSDSTFDSTVFTAMGILVGIVVVGVAILTVWVFVAPKADPATTLAIRVAMVLLLIGQGLGGLLLANGFANTGPIGNASIVGSAGQLKVPHALALHGLQVLVVLAALLERSTLDLKARLRAVVLCAVGYADVLSTSLLQALSGRAPFDLGPAALLVMLFGVGLVLWGYIPSLGAARSFVVRT